MSNIVATIPKGSFDSWQVAERICIRCDGTTDWGNGEWFWTINCQHLPTKLREDSVCYMAYDGLLRGYFDIIETDLAKNWSNKEKGYTIVMANWHPMKHEIEQKGFQGYRYIDIMP